MSMDLIQESVPPFTKRIGDRVIQGSNNTMIIMGTDRAAHGPADTNSGLGNSDGTDGGKGAGAIHLLVGRADKDGNPDLDKDPAYIYISAKTSVDDNLALTSVEKSSNGKSAVVVKSDDVRIVFRDDMKISSDDGKQYVYVGDHAVISVGGNTVKVATDGVVITVGGSTVTVKANGAEISSPFFRVGGGAAGPRQDMFNSLVQALLNHSHMTAVGPATTFSTSPMNASLVSDMTGKLASFLGQCFSPPDV